MKSTEKVVVKDGKLVYRNNTADFSDEWVQCTPRSQSKMVMLGGFKRECKFTFNGLESKTFKSIKDAKDEFKKLIDLTQHLYVDSKQIVDIGKDVFGNDIADIFGINELINRKVN